MSDNQWEENKKIPITGNKFQEQSRIKDGYFDLNEKNQSTLQIRKFKSIKSTEEWHVGYPK